MADLKDKQIRLVGSQNFAYATGSSYTQGHVHFTTDEHGSIVVNGKVYGTTDATYVYVGSYNVPAYVAYAIDNALESSYKYADDTLKLSYAYTYAKINALDGKESGSGRFVYHVDQTNGIVTTHKHTLQYLVAVDNSEAKAYAPKGTNESVKFIKSFEIEGDTIIPKYDYFANNVPGVTVTDNRTNDTYAPKFDTNNADHTINIGDGTRLATYSEFNDLKEVVDRFFGDADLDTKEVKSYIDTLAEIQEAFKNSYAEGIANSINYISFEGNLKSNSYELHISYKTNGSNYHKDTSYIAIPFGSNTAYGLVKYDNNTIKKNNSGQLYVDGELTDTKYTLSGVAFDVSGENGAYLDLKENGTLRNRLNIKGAGIAKVTYDGEFIITVPETVVNYNHHSSNGTSRGTVLAYADGKIEYNVITNVSLSSDGKLTYSYANLAHGEIFGSFINVTYGSNASTTHTAVPGAIMTLKVPSIKVNKCGHVVDLKENTVNVNFSHDHDEFVWL